MGYVKTVSALCVCSNYTENNAEMKTGIELKLKKRSFVIPTFLLAVNTDMLIKHKASF